MKMRRVLRLRGIREKLLVSFSLLVTSIAIFVFAFFPARLERVEMRGQTSKARTITEVMARSLGAGLSVEDGAAVHEVLDGVSHEADVVALIVRDTTGHMFALRSTRAIDTNRILGTPPGTTSADGLLYIAAAPIKNRALVVGTLTLAISLRDLHEEVLNAQRVGALVGLLIFAAGFLTVYAISTLVTRPLNAVSRTVERIAAGELNLRADETADAEVSQLVRAFNRMVSKLAQAQADLSANNAQLEQRVGVRTAELQLAVADQRQARLAVIESELEARAIADRLRSLVEAAPQAILSVDLSWNITRWNRAAEKLFGWTADELLGKSKPIIPPDQQDTLLHQRKLMERGCGTAPASRCVSARMARVCTCSLQ